MRPGMLIFFFTLFVTFYVTKAPAFSLIASFLKAGLFIVYFGFVFDGTFTFSDDWKYISGGNEVINYDIRISNLNENFVTALTISQSNHFVYYIYNAYSIRFFGNEYYAPVAMNILLTVLIALLGSLVVKYGFGFSKKEKKWFFALLLIHPDILAWSTIANLKDILVLLLHVQLLLSVILLYKSRYFFTFLLLTPTLMILFFLRFYVPVLFAVAFFISHFNIKTNRNRMFFLGGLLIILVIMTIVGTNTIQYAFVNIKKYWSNPVYGFIKFLITPIPFNTEEEYSFLNFPALIHWFLLPFVFIGFQKIRRTGTPFCRFFICYCICFFCLSSIYTLTQGPRHRVQLNFAFTLMQYIGFVDFFQNIFQNKLLNLRRNKVLKGEHLV